MSLYSKLLLILLPLLLIPLLVIRVAVVAESDLRHAQEQRLLNQAKVYAELLKGQKQAMARWPEMGTLALQEAGVIFPTRMSIAIDGRVGDWAKLADQSQLFANNELLQAQPGLTPTVSVRFLATHDNESLYLLFMVKDDNVTYRKTKQLALNRNDYVSLMLRDDQGALRRYVVSAKKSGLTPVHRVKNTSDELAVERDKRLRSYWRASKFGYNVEVRVPLKLAANGLGFAVADVDKHGQSVLARIGTLARRWEPQIQRFSQPSPQLEMFLRSFDLAEQQSWVADTKGRVIAVGGSPQGAASSHPRAAVTHQQGLERAPLPEWRRRLYLWFFSRWLPLDERRWRAVEQSGESDQSPVPEHLLSALKGQAASQWRAVGNGLWKLSAAAPIAANADNSIEQAEREPIGAVVIEEAFSAAAILSNSRIVRLLEWAMLLAFCCVIATVLLMLTVVWRMRRLRSAMRRAVAGRPPEQWPDLNAADELGELSRSTALLAAASSEASQYILALGNRLSGGLKPAAALIGSSADLLELKASEAEGAQEAGQPYITRLRAGLHQLDAVLDRVTAPQRLKRLIAEARPEDFDLAAVLDVCIASYRRIYPQQGFAVRAEATGVKFHGVPELFALIVHELVANAIQNARKGTDIEIQLEVRRRQVLLTVSNRGLAINIADQRIFSAFMTANANPIRAAKESTGEQGNESTLMDDREHPVTQYGEFAHGWGVGLYLAELASRELGGQLRLKNHSDKRGVTAELLLHRRSASA